MGDKRGFTLIEIIVALVIVGILVAVILPNVITSVEQTKAQAAKNNLLAISAAQQRYFEDNSVYCTGTSSSCGDNNLDLNNNLRLSIPTNDPFIYSCTAAPAPYQCTASDGTDLLTLTVNVSTLAVSVSCSNIAGRSGYCSY